MNVWGTEVVAEPYAGHPGRQLWPRPRSLGEMLASAQPDRTFLVQGERRITAGRFLGAIEPAAETLVGVEPGDHVLVHAYNSPDWALALFAVWRRGAVPVLGNRWWGPAELAHAIDLTKPALVLDDAGVAALGPAFDNPAFDKAGEPGRLPVPAEDDPAVVIFTSGSSGQPKGVVLAHRSVIANQHNLLARSRRLPTGDPPAARPVTLVCTPLFHIGGISNLLTNLIIGGTIVLTEGRFDPTQVLRLIEAEGVQSFGGVPTMAVRVLEHPDFDRYDLSSLRSWPLGGAPVSAALLARMASRLPQLKRRGLGNTWGMSESGGFLTVAGNRDLAERPGTVGRPYPVVELRIDDGEILVRSPTVMLGYLGIDDGTVDDDGWLHTGDLGHLDDDGYLYLDGRSKDIVIRGGENIACAHVELALLRHPDVVEVAVLGVPHPALGEELAAVVVHRNGSAPRPDALQEFLAGTLAYFAVPTRWRLRTVPLPTLAGEKTDKKALRALFTEEQPC